MTRVPAKLQSEPPSRPTTIPSNESRSTNSIRNPAHTNCLRLQTWSRTFGSSWRICRAATPRQKWKRFANSRSKNGYVWRVVSAMKWALADFDDLGISADRQTLGSDDLAKVMDLLKLRPIQFCMFLAALVGAEQMERTLLQAISVAKQS